MFDANNNKMFDFHYQQSNYPQSFIQIIDTRLNNILQNENNIVTQQNDINKQITSLNTEQAQINVENANLATETRNMNATIGNQNTALSQNMKLTDSQNAADQQKVFYQKLQTDYIVMINFYLFYFYTLLAILFFYPCFFVDKEHNFYAKIFVYLHILFYPYLVVYYEFVVYYIWQYCCYWISGNPFYPWNNYTSYPPII